MDYNKFLRYGDSVYICSAEGAKTYLCARSLQEERVLFIQSPSPSENNREDIDSTFYENQSELLFTIYPKLSYQAEKNYDKIKPSDSVSRKKLLKERKEAEEDQNDDVLEKVMFTPITFGSEVQLFHMRSKSFVRVTREKHPKMSELYKLRLSRKGGSGVYFKISPFLTFKREGEKISLKDPFYLENTKLQANLVYELAPPDAKAANPLLALIKLKTDVGASGSSKQYMPLLELGTTFNKLEAGLKHSTPDQNPAFTIKLVSSQIPLPTSKTLLWGDYVRIRFMVNNEQTGYLFSDHTVIGNAPNINCRTLNTSIQFEKESFQAIFQIVPLSEDFYGRPVQFAQDKTVPMRLRHVLTGRYLLVTPYEKVCKLSETIDEFLAGVRPPYLIESETPMTQKDFTPMLRGQESEIQLRTAHSQYNVIKSSKKVMFNPHSGSASATAKRSKQNQAAYDFMKSAAGAEKSPELEKPKVAFNINQGGAPANQEKTDISVFPNEEIFNETDDIKMPSPVSEFMIRTQITLRNVSYDDDDEYLTYGSVFTLEALQKYPHLPSEAQCSLSIERHDNTLRTGGITMEAAPMNDDENFRPRFHERNPLGKSDFNVVMASQSVDNFHFTTVPPEEISEIMVVHSLLFPITQAIKEIENQPFEGNPFQAFVGQGNLRERRSLRNVFGVSPRKGNDDTTEKKIVGINSDAYSSIKKLTEWMAPPPADESSKFKTLSLSVKQKMMRELGIIDVLIDLLELMFERKLLKDDPTLGFYKALTQSIFEILQETIRRNKPNNVYVFQWSQLLQKIALTKDLASELGVDKLLSQIFYEQIIEINELADIPKYLAFEDFDLKALNIAIALYRYNPARSVEEREQIVKTLIVNKANRTRIFREYEREGEAEIIVRIQNGVKKIDPGLEYREKKNFDFATGIINLATEITRSKPQVVFDYLSELFPLSLCTNVFQNRRWHYHFRSAFLDLFLEMYFSIESIRLPQISFPNTIKFLSGTKASDEMYEIIETRKSAVHSRFMTQEFHIKKFIREFLDDPHRWSDDEHRYVKSVFHLIYAMCVRGLYNRDDLQKLKNSIYAYLKVGLAAIHDTISPDGEHYVKKPAQNAQNTQNGKQEEKEIKSKASLKSRGKSKSKDPDDTSILNDKSIDTVKEEEEEPAPTKGEDPEFEREEPYWKSTERNEMISWMQEGLHVLNFIERYELDSKLKEFFQEEKTVKFFNEKLFNRPANSVTLSAQAINKIKTEKVAYVMKYMDDNFVLQNYKFTLLLIEMLLINNLSFTCQIVHLLYLNFSNFKNFLISLNGTETINPSNIEIYNHYFVVYDKLRLYKIALEALQSQAVTMTADQIYDDVNKVLSELLADLYMDGDKAADGKPGDQMEVYELYEDYRFENKMGKQKQSLLKSFNFQNVVTDLFISLVKGVYYETRTYPEEKYLETFLHFYAFFCCKNPENQLVMAEDPSFLEHLLSIDAPTLQPLLLRVVSEIYKDNYSVLIHIPQKQNNVIRLLLDKFFKNFSYEEAISNEFFILCLRIFPTFFQIRNNFLSQNQTYFANRFHIKLTETSSTSLINSIFMDQTLEFLKNNRPENHVLPENPKAVKVPFQISFAIHLLNTFSRMVTGRHFSNSLSCLKNKSYLSIIDISTLLKEAGDWFNLKLALITFLNHVYVRNKKLEDNEVIDLYDIVRDSLFAEMNEYNRFLKNRHLYPRPYDQQFVQSFKPYYPVSTDYIYSEVIDDSYHQYILYGVMNSFKFYAKRMKDQPSDQDHNILDDYVCSTLHELKDLWNHIDARKATLISPMMNKMLAPLEEPSEPEISEGDILVPQKNERKEAVELKKELIKMTKAIRQADKAQELKICQLNGGVKEAKSIKDQLLIEMTTIEDKHSSELEILVKFLLELKIENPLKFKKIIKSFMKVLASEETDPQAKQSTLQILRKLSNFKDDPDMYESIQTDLIQLGLINFFNYVIIHTKNEDDRLEFILGMVDFMDEASLKIQEEFYEELVEDEENLLLDTLKKFILTNFEDFRENEKNYNEQSQDIQQNAKIVVYRKMYRVIYALELLRLSCENHYEPMQNYLREQVQNGVKNKRSINFIHLLADIFNRYAKSVNERNAQLGLKILGTLIEMLQGPCQENQIALCNTKLLENIEDLTVEIKNIRRKKDMPIWAEMNNKIITLIQAILEGSYNNYVMNQVAIHMNVSLFLERMEEIYNKFYKERSRKKPEKSKKKVKKIDKTSTMSVYGLENEILDNDAQEDDHDNYALFINEGIELGIILSFLSNIIPDIKQKIDRFRQELEIQEPERYWEFLKAEDYYNKRIGQIEISNKKGDLQRIYFPIVKKTKYLSSVTKEDFLEDVNRESANEKLFGLLNNRKIFTSEMDHFFKLRKRGMGLSLRYFSFTRDANLLLAFATNLTILFDRDITNPQAEDDDGNPIEGGDSYADDVVMKLGIVHIVLCGLVLIFWGIFQAPLELKAASNELDSEIIGDDTKLETTKNGSRSAWFVPYIKVKYVFSRISYMLTNTYMVYFILAFTFAMLGTFYSKIFFAFLMFDIIDRSVILNNVVKAVTNNYKQLLMTVVLGIMLIYIYSVIGYFGVIRDDDITEISDGNGGTQEYMQLCTSVWHCFLTLANDGIRAGGGIGDILQTQIGFGEEGFAPRFFYELFYFLTIIIILLNIVFGIIIDTFAELRDEKRMKDFDEKNVCFICNLERTVFEKEGVSFDKHVRIEHNIWNYLYYVVYLDQKDKFELNGTETYIYEKIENDDLSWFPIQRALCLSTDQKEEKEDMNAIIGSKLASFEGKVVEALKASATTRHASVNMAGSAASVRKSPYTGTSKGTSRK